MFQCTKRAYTNGVLVCVCPRGSTVDHLACTGQPWRHTGMGGSVYFCSCSVVEYCANQDATLTLPTPSANIRHLLPKTVRNNQTPVCLYHVERTNTMKYE